MCGGVFGDVGTSGVRVRVAMVGDYEVTPWDER